MRRIKRSRISTVESTTFSVYDDENVPIRANIAKRKLSVANHKYPFGHFNKSRTQIVDIDHSFYRGVQMRLWDKLRENTCDHSLDLAEQILRSLPNVDVEKTLDFYRENGGNCDCEVLYNIYDDAPNLKPSGY